MSQARIHTHKRLYIVIASIILLVAIGVGVFLFLRQNDAQKTASSSQTQTSKVPQEKVVFQTQQTASDKVKSGDVAGALSTYDSAIKNSSDDVTKSMLYSQKSLLASNNNQPDVALAAALAAVKADANGGTLSNLAYIYELKGDKTDASKYYTEAADAIENDPNAVSTTSSNSYRQKAQELQSK